MLRIIASSAAHYAIDGVISGDAVDQASRAERLEHVARRRARHLLDEAESKAEATFRQAAETGYAQGYADAVAAFVPQALELLQQEHILVETALDHVRGVLRSDLEQLGFEVPVIAQWCHLQVQDASTRATLHVPRSREDLAAALCKHPLMQDVDTRLGEVNHPLLEVGKLAFEFDPDRLLLKKTEPLMFEDAWKEQLSHHALIYADRIKSMLNSQQLRNQLKSLEAHL